MKSIKFKNTSIQNRHRIIATVFITICFVVFNSYKIGSFIGTNLEEYLTAQVKKENMLILKEAFSYLINDDVDMSNLAQVVRNSKDEIIKIDFNIQECTKILSNITGHINAGLEDYNYIGYKLDVPLSFIGNSPLFKNLGPKIPIKVELSDIALGNVRTSVREFGINNALLEIYLDVTINTEALYPLSTLDNQSTYEALVYSTMISGVVPSFYNGQINSKSDVITLPLGE